MRYSIGQSTGNSIGYSRMYSIKKFFRLSAIGYSVVYSARYM